MQQQGPAGEETTATVKKAAPEAIEEAPLPSALQHK